MKISRSFLASCLLLVAVPGAHADVETLVCLRHGEKTSSELGQLSIRGLNRSLALPAVLLSRFGTPQFIFAPDPARNLVGGRNGKPYQYYLRPLATIEPTAIELGLPVNTAFGFMEIDGLEHEILQPGYRNAVVIIAWEHLAAAKFAAKVVADLGGSAAEVPAWPANDYDSLYVIRIERNGGRTSVTFKRDSEGLDGMSSKFPSPAPSSQS
jgi:hypothetical protein